MPKMPSKKHRPWVAKTKDEELGHGFHRKGKGDPFYHTAAWRKLRNKFIHAQPLCQHCKRKGEFIQGNVVDHVRPIAAGGAPLDAANLQTLCNSCHNRKSAKERKVWKKHYRNDGEGG